jgi:NADH-quinone oxidoreductase subunit G
MIDIEIDGKPLQAEQGAMIIEVADQNGIAIPRFCYHKKLSIAANCRMCLVEVEKSGKPLPACATPVTAGMKVFTHSQKARDSQKAVMEFLLINHPLDCPICDQGGECELQDLSLTYGKDVSRFNIGKRSVKDDNLGPLIATEMTRCIQCTRCVRFGQEIAGIRELGATGRGENMQITTYVEHSIESELSGNIIDLCPVGALTAKPSRFTARAWELQQHAAIAPHDCVGSNIYVHTRRNQVIRVAPQENEALNETWISDRDRFSYLALHSPERLQRPMIKVNGLWQEADWATALDYAVTGLQKIIKEYGAKQIATLASPSATTEELYLLQKLIRGLGANMIDHRLHQIDVSDQKQAPLYPKLSFKLADIEQQDVILLIGSNVQREQPIIGHRIRKATLRGAKVLSVNLVDHAFNFEQQNKIIVAPQHLVRTLAGIAKALGAQQAVEPTVEEKNIAEQLKNSQKKIILLGALARNHPEAATIRALVQMIADLTQAKWGCLREGANSIGAWLAGAVPHRAAAGAAVPDAGLAANVALAASLKSYLLFGVEPELDCANSAAAINALSKAEFTIAFTPFKSATQSQYAHVLLPIALFAETAGTFVNIEGTWQSFAATVNPPHEVKAGWKVLRVLANQLNLTGFDYEEAFAVRDELRKMVDEAIADNNVGQVVAQQLPDNNVRERYAHPDLQEKNETITRITEWPIYSIDSTVRHAQALQYSATSEPSGVYMNAELAARLQVQPDQIVTIAQGGGKAQLPVMISARIPNDCVWIPAGRIETINLGATFGAVEIFK